MSLVCKTWSPITRRALHSIAGKSRDNVFENIKQCLAASKYICITIDIWTDRRLRAFIGITAHHIDDLFKFKSDVLACRNITITHTGENIKKELDYILNEFNIKYL